MPRCETNYSKTIIYKLVCKDTAVTDCYVGHTTRFPNRKAMHKYNADKIQSRQHNYYVYRFIRENGGFSNWDMVQIEEYPCENSRQAETRERYWLETLKASLNKNIPTRSKTEWEADFPEKVKQHKAKWRNANKEYIKAYSKIYNENKKLINQDGLCVLSTTEQITPTDTPAVI
jgi:hypothetical protein